MKLVAVSNGGVVGHLVARPPSCVFIVEFNTVGKLEDAPLNPPVTRFRKDDPPAWLSDTRERRTLRG